MEEISVYKLSDRSLSSTSSNTNTHLLKHSLWNVNNQTNAVQQNWTPASPKQKIQFKFLRFGIIITKTKNWFSSETNKALIFYSRQWRTVNTERRVKMWIKPGDCTLALTPFFLQQVPLRQEASWSNTRTTSEYSGITLHPWFRPVCHHSWHEIQLQSRLIMVVINYVFMSSLWHQRTSEKK